MEIRYTHKAENDFQKLSFDVQKRIAKKMRFYASQVNPLKFSKRLENSDEGEFRFRIGNYRVVFDLIDGIIFVLKIAKRDKAYRDN